MPATFVGSGPAPAAPLGLRHPPALFCAPSASLGAALAMVHLMFGAFFSACFANLRTKLAKCLGEFTASRHVTGRQAANLRAIHIQLYATRHALNVLFPQAGNSAMVALCSAGITSVDARLILFMRHIDLQ